DVGSSGGQAAAFTFDLPRSIALTRQGNPAWAGTERDGSAPIRSDDMFFGGSATDWVNLSKVAIPQADEQQRLLTNLIQVMNRDRKPLPRFWYFPRNLKAVVIATGDDHGNNGTAGRFDQYLANSPAGCSVADWTCPRFSSYVYPSTPLSNAAATSYTAQGFEVGVHETTNCGNFTPATLQNFYANDIAAWRTRFPSLPNPVSNRTHCIAYSDWASQPKVGLANGMRMDGNYYYWPDTWVQNRPGFMTGSGMPMRFTDTDGTMIDNFQAASQMTDESGQSSPFTPNTLLDNAIGPLGYYGAFNANMHTDSATTLEDDNLITSAQSRGVPLVSGKQMVTWLDGRNASSFTNIAWSANTLSFGVAVGAGANGLSGMLPTAGPNGTQLTALTRGGTAVPFTKSTIKGLEYASFTAATGSYSATYAVTGSPQIAKAAVATVQAPSADTAVVSWDTSEPTTSEVSYGTSPDAMKAQVTVGDATRQHRVTLTGLTKGAKYYYRLGSEDTTGSKATFPATSSGPATFTTEAADTTKPKLANPGVIVLTGGSATVSWTSSEPTSSVMRYGRSAEKLDSEVVDRELVTDHTVTLTGLDVNRTYWIGVTATDASGNETTSKTFKFITLGSGVVEQTTASFRRGTTTGQAVVDDSGQGSVTLSGKGAGRSGTFVSGLLDAQAMVDWDRVAWRAKVPTGTTLTVSGRVGSTDVPDGTWSKWKTVTSGQRVKASGRYVQYRLELTASGAASPVLYAIGASNNGGPLPVVTETR
ncbi:MAG: fibronectin type III domain-containing protein, partial [Propionibacteriaceae bacterium]